MAISLFPTCLRQLLWPHPMTVLNSLPRWITPEGQRFEVQFHTTESFHAKQQVTHRPYERIRNPLTQDEERPELERFQEEVSRWVATPEGAQEIPDHARRGR